MKTTTTFVRDRFPNPIAGLPGVYGRNHYMRPAYDGEDGGDEGGGGGDEGGDNTPPPYEFKDDSGFVRVPGIKDPIAVKDLIAAHNLRDQHTSSMKIMGQIAEALKAQGGRAPQQKGGQQQNQQQQRQDDPFAELEAMEIPDGKSLAKVLRSLNESSLSPMGKVITAMAKRLQAIEGNVGTHNQREADTAFSGEVKGIIDSLKLPRVNNQPIEGEQVLEEIARDLFYSYHDEDQPKLRQNGEFGKQVQARFKSLRQFFRNYEKAELEAAKVRQRQKLFAPKGPGTPGQGKPKPRLTNDQLADMLFSTPAST